MPPHQKKSPRPQKITKNYFFSISISPEIKKIDFKNFIKNYPPPQKSLMET